MTKKTWKLSASFIQTFKACSYRCFIKYVLGIIPIEDTDALRMGTNWHRLLEIMGMRPGGVCMECANTAPNSRCPLCEGTNILPEDLMDAVLRHLNQAYEVVPLSKTKDEWLAERAKLLYSCAGYNWQYADDDCEVVAEEIQFRLPVRNPETGRALPNVTLDGKIDKIVKSSNGLYYIDEHKSTSNSLDPDSPYWKHLALDTQTRLYVYAAQQLQLTGELEQYGIKPTDPLICNVRYDVWHKPTISPKKLTQAESKKFVGDGKYMGDEFEVMHDANFYDHPAYIVNNEVAEVTPGKKEGTFAIRETPDMYGARLLQDIGERPEFYFCRKPLPRTEPDIKRFEKEIYNIYHAVKFLARNDAWWMDESQCEAKFKCPYIPICYNNVDLSDGELPEGFRFTKWKERENAAKKETK